MRLLTKWQHWWVSGRMEHRFHCDLLLGPKDRIEIVSSDGHRQVIESRDGFVKVHLSASWEHRPTEFVE